MGEYGYSQNGTPKSCTLNELREKIRRGWGMLPLVWTPQSPRFVPAVEAACLFDVVKARLIRTMIFTAVRWLLLGAGLAVAIVFNARQEHAKIKDSLPTALLLLAALGGIPAIQALRNAWALRSFDPLDIAYQGGVARYSAWLNRKRLPAIWFIGACILIVAYCQTRIGWDASAQIAGLIKPLPPGQSWRLLTCALLHGNLLHLGMNFFALLILGRWMEVHSRWLYVPLVFVVAALVGSLTSLWLSPHAGTMVGASGGLMGLIGFLAVMGYRRRAVLPEGFFGMMVANVILIGLMGAAAHQVIDNAAHAGGLAAGVALGLLIFLRLPTRRPRTLLLAGGGAATLVLAVTCAQAASLILRAANVESSLRSLPPAVREGPKYLNETDRFKALFEIPGKFHLTSGALDARQADGWAIASLSGQFQTPGLYVFEFKHVDDRDWAYEARNVRVRVWPGGDSSSVLVSPDDRVWSSYPEGMILAVTGATARVQWVEEAPGAMGHWRLDQVAYGETADRP
jgi:membrane associated rhomboid family serine protease